MNELERMYYEYYSQYVEHEDMKDTCQTRDALVEYLTKQGFVFGFQYAVSLLMSGKAVIAHE